MNPDTADSHSIALPKGTVIGTYTIEYLLGSGGFGLTYCASNRLGQKVAIKELLPDGMAIRVNGSTVYPKTDRFAADFKWAVERFEGEARTLVGLEHPHIVKVHDLIEANNTAYMVMEYIEGESLAESVRRLTRQGARYSEQAVWEIFETLLDAADYIHKHQLIHRDIKPANILLKGNREGSEGGQAVLIALGSARQDIGQSVSMTSVVSRGFSSFEQYNSRGKNQGPWSDIYSLAATIYFVCTGGESPAEAAERFEAPERPGWVKRALGDAYSDRLIAMLETGMAVKVADRPRNIREWRAIGRSSEVGGGSSRLEKISCEENLDQQEQGSSHSRTKKITVTTAKITGVVLLVVLLIGLKLVGKSLTRDWGREAWSEAWEELSTSRPEGQEKENAMEETSSAAKSQPTSTDIRQLLHKTLLKEAEKLLREYTPLANAKASEMLQQAAKEGYAPAQALLGKCYIVGIGVERNIQTAIDWCLKAAEQGDPFGFFYLGWVYEEGMGGIVKDESKSQQYYQQAKSGLLMLAEQENVRAQANLGLMYEYGTGVPKDEKEAVKWYRKAAEQGFAAAQNNLGMMYADGKGGLQKDDREAIKWYRKAAEQGDAEAQNMLGVMYAEGTGVPKDEEEAVKWYRKAADQGNAWAQNNLGEMYEDGRGGLLKSRIEAVKLYQKAAAQGNEMAKAKLQRLGE